jgi:hypothetical protein
MAERERRRERERKIARWRERKKSERAARRTVFHSLGPVH